MMMALEEVQKNRGTLYDPNSLMPKGEKMSVEKFDKRFGVVAVEKGFITPEQLIEAMKIQIMEEIENSKHQLIGEILWDKGYLTKLQVNEVLISTRALSRTL